jgi:hypothetical protein
VGTHRHRSLTRHIALDPRDEIANAVETDGNAGPLAQVHDVLASAQLGGRKGQARHGPVLV